MMRALILTLVLVAGPAAAQQQLNLPRDCTAFLTVQNAGCTVQHHFTCAGDPEGHRHAIELFGDGYDFYTVTDAEGQWIETVDAYNGTHERLMENPADPGLYSALIDDGVDTFDFDTQGADGSVTRFVGTDKLTGARVVIDGVELLEFVTEMRAEDNTGAELWSMTATGVLSTEWRMGMGGRVNWITPTESYSTDDSPVEFILPGEPGFLSAVPQYGCGG